MTTRPEELEALVSVNCSPHLEPLFELAARLEQEGRLAEATEVEAFLGRMRPPGEPRLGGGEETGASGRPRLFDCFMFFNELELLELRLEELWDVVDFFVLVEGTRTFTMRPKPALYREHRSRFARFESKIIHVLVDQWPEGSASLVEKYQRNCILQGLAGARDNDLLALSDVDELPRASMLAALKGSPPERPVNLLQTMSFYFLNCALIDDWLGTSVCTVRQLRERFRGLPANFRRVEGKWAEGLDTLPDAGWHFSYLGGPEAIRYKLQSFSHQEYNDDVTNDLEHIRRCVNALENLFPVWKDRPFRVLPLESLTAQTMPRTVAGDLGRFLERGLLTKGAQSR